MYTTLRTRIAIATIALTLSLTTGVATVVAHPVDTQSGKPQGACPASFHPHAAEEHNHEGGHAHQHAGTDADLNGDDLICVKHVGNGQVHVHIDNNLPE